MMSERGIQNAMRKSPVRSFFTVAPPSWAAFAILVVAGSGIAYVSIPIPSKILLFLGVVLPILVFLANSPAPTTSKATTPITDRTHRLILGILLAAGLLARFIDLGSYATWPLFDEGVDGLYALDNIDGWDGRLRYYFSSLPPLFIWLLAGLFHGLQPSKSTLWLLPALCATGAWLLLYATTRLLASKIESLWILGWTAFSFWALQPGRHAHPYVLLLFWECLCGYLAVHIVVNRKMGRPSWMALLGACIGVGFYTFYTWIWMAPTALAIAAVVYRDRLRDPAIRRGAFFLCLGPLLMAIPHALSFMRGEYGGHLLRLLNPTFVPQDVFDRLAHLTALVTAPLESFCYGPFWGGFLNPIESSLFLLGCVETYRRRREPVFRFMATLMFVFFVPMLFVLPVNFTRLVHLLPLSCFFIFHGMRLLGIFRLRTAWPLVFLLAISSVLSLYHLWGPARAWSTQPARWEYQRRIEDARVYDLLCSQARSQGPGYLFLRLNSGIGGYVHLNPSLYVLSYPWNVLANPRLMDRTPEWIAIFTNEPLQPFLAGLVPGIQWHPLSDPPGPPGRNHVLGIAPLQGIDRDRLDRWLRAEKILQGLYRWNLEDPEFELNPTNVYSRYRERLLSEYVSFRSDPFLRAVFQEKLQILEILPLIPGSNAIVPVQPGHNALP